MHSVIMFLSWRLKNTKNNKIIDMELKNFDRLDFVVYTVLRGDYDDKQTKLYENPDRISG